MPGQIARIGGRSFWFYPGGFSIDFFLRKAGHNLFMTSPEVTTAIERFMRGEPLKSPQITVPLPDFTPALEPTTAVSKP